MKRICIVCKNVFVPRRIGFGRFCSSLCARESKREYDLHRYRQNKDYFSAKARNWERKNRWKCLERVTRWKKENPDKLSRCLEDYEQRQKAALAVYREMGFEASEADKKAIYKALKAELPTLNI